MTSRAAAFIGVGAAGFVLQLGVLHGLTTALHVPYAAATALAVEAAVLTNFGWHERWTWRDRAVDADGRWTRLLRFHVGTGFTSIAGNVMITVLVVAWLKLSPVLANAVAVAVMSAANFAIADRWVFRNRPAPRGGSVQERGARTSTPADCRPARIHAARDGAPAVSP